LASDQLSGWFIYRPPFNGFDDLRKVVEWLLKDLEGDAANLRLRRVP